MEVDAGAPFLSNFNKQFGGIGLSYPEVKEADSVSLLKKPLEHSKSLM
jgi:hypothetical protein